MLHTYCPISQKVKAVTKKLGQLIEYNMGNISLEKSCTKCDGETVPRHFSKKCIWINSLKVNEVCFYCMLIWGLLKYIEYQDLDHLFLPYIKLF